MNVKDQCKSKYQLLINRRKKGRTKKLKNPKTFIDYSQAIDSVYENLEKYNPTKKRKLLIVLDDKIADMEAKKRSSPIVTDLFLRGKKLNIFLVFISQSYFKVLNTIKLNATHYFIM